LSRKLRPFAPSHSGRTRNRPWQERHAAAESRGVKLTYDEFVLFPDDGLRYELID